MCVDRSERSTGLCSVDKSRSSTLLLSRHVQVQLRPLYYGVDSSSSSTGLYNVYTSTCGNILTVWTRRVNPFPSPAVWTCRVYPPHRLQCGRAGCIHQQLLQCERAECISTPTSKVDMQGVSLFTACCIDVQDVSNNLHQQQCLGEWLSKYYLKNSPVIRGVVDSAYRWYVESLLNKNNNLVSIFRTLKR